MSHEGEVQITDFGLSSIPSEIQGFNTVGQWNVRYHAPELLSVTEPEVYAGPTYASDIFSLGMLLLQVRRQVSPSKVHINCC